MECVSRGFEGRTTKVWSVNMTLSALMICMAASTTALYAQSTLVYQFQGGSGATADGTYPNAGLVADASGNLYGTTWSGGNYSNGGCTGVGCGTIYKLTKGTSNYSESILYRFQGCVGGNCGSGSDGATPGGTLIFDSYGNLYGTTANGGNQGCSASLLGCGTVFVLCENPASPASTTACNSQPANTEITLARMGTSVGSNQRHPLSSLVMDGFGNLYGTSLSGSNNCGIAGCGGVFVVCAPGAGTGDPSPCVPNATSYAYNEIYQFTGLPNGAQPHGGLVMDSAGNLYGTATLGGTNNTSAEPCGKIIDTFLISGCGLVFKLSPSGSAWTETVLYTFLGYPTDGSYPSSTLILDSSGNLYGTTEVGPRGGGTVFELSPVGNSWNESLLYKFTNRWDGGNTYGGVTLIGLNGVTYLAGNTYSGGGGNLGAVYVLKRNSGVWKEVGGIIGFASNAQQAVYSFEDGGDYEGQCPVGTDGCNPYGNVIFLNTTINNVTQNYLMGTTYYGGSAGFGTVYAVKP